MTPTRSFKGTRQLSRLVPFALIAALPCTLAAGVVPRFEVTGQQIAATMQHQDFSIDGVAVKVGAAITATVAAPELIIQSAAMISPHQVRLRISCTTGAECLPFYADATWPDSTPPVTIPAGLSTRNPNLTKSPNLEASLHRGAPAILQLEDGRIHIQLQVLCLEGGAVGDKIHVTTKDHRQSYVAQVVAANLLKGTL